jgi:hypothetical protein
MEPILRSQWFLSDVKQLDHVELAMDEWLDMTYNGNLLSLKLRDEQLVHEENRKAIGFRYFDMDFPVLLSKTKVCYKVCLFGHAMREYLICCGEI